MGKKSLCVSYTLKSLFSENAQENTDFVITGLKCTPQLSAPNERLLLVFISFYDNFQRSQQLSIL